MVDVAKIRIAAEGDVSGLATSFARGAEHITGFERTVKGSFDRVNKAFSSLSTSQKVFAGVGLGIGLLGTSIAAVIGPAIKFESAFAGVRKTVDGTPRQLEDIRQGILDMSRVMPTAADELASIAENAGQLGVKAPDVLAFTRNIAMLGETTDLSFDDAAQSLARFLNITGSGASGIGRVSDVLVALGNNSATTESQIVDFSTRLASAFTVAGAAEHEILALASSFSSLGLRAEAGGSALSTIITKISDAALDGGSELRTYADTAGLLPEQFAKIAETNPVEALLLFGEGLANVRDEGGSITPILEELGLGGLRTSEVFRLLALNSGFVREQLALAAGEFERGGAAQAEFDKRVETTASQLDILKNRLEVIRIEAGTPLLGGLVAGANLAGDAVEALIAAVAPLGAALLDLASAGGGAAGPALTVLGTAAGFAVDSLGGAATVVAVLVSALTGLHPSLTTAAAAAGLLALAWNTTPVLAFRVALLTVQAQIAATGVAATAASLGMSALNLAMRVGPFVALGAVLLLIGRNMRAAGDAADAAGAQFAEGFAGAIERADFAALNRHLSLTSIELARLQGVSDGSSLSFGQAAANMFGFSNTVATARAEISELEEQLAATRADDLIAGLDLVSGALGVTGQRALELTTTAEALDIVMKAGAARLEGDVHRAYIFGEQAVAALTGSMLEAAGGSQVMVDAILDGSASIEQMADQLQITDEQLLGLASRLEGVDLGALVGDDDIAKLEAYTAVEEHLITVTDQIAERLGITRTEAEASAAAMFDLSSSFDVLSAAVSAAGDALGALSTQRSSFEAATASFEEALAVGEWEAAASAIRDATLAHAAYTGTGENTLAFHNGLITSFQQLARDAGIADDEIAFMILTLAGVPPATIAELELLADDFIADAEAAKGEIESFVENPWVAILSAENSGALEGIAGAVASATGYTTGDYDPPIKAHDAGAQAEFAARFAQANEYANATYDAAAKAHDAGAQSLFAGATVQGRAFADGDYDAGAEAHDVNVESTFSTAQNLAQTWNTTTATATVNVNDNATAKLSGIIGLIGRVQRGATAQVNLGLRGGLAEGGILTRFDGGGIAAGAVRESPNKSKIFSPATPFRFFAEPAAGPWESFISGAPQNHERSVAIWERTGHLLGVMAHGAIQTATRFQDGGISVRAPSSSQTSLVSISAPIRIDISGAGRTDERVLAEMIGERVDRSLKRVTRDLENRRRVLV